MLSSDELRRLRLGFENCREALGFEHDILIGCHWEFDLRSAIDMAVALTDVKPLFLEDPLPVAYSESWRRLAEMSPVPICTGENWMRRAEALPFVVNAAIDILHPDLRNSGGFLENKRMADLADLYFLPMANHNTGSIVNGMATVHWGSTVRDYFACETVFFDGGWMDDVIVHGGGRWRRLASSRSRTNRASESSSIPMSSRRTSQTGKLGGPEAETDSKWDVGLACSSQLTARWKQ